MKAMTDFHQTWYVGSRGTPIWFVVTEYAYLIPHSHIYSNWLIIKKVKYPEVCMGYIDETWYVGSDGHKYYPRGLSSSNVHI